MTEVLLVNSNLSRHDVYFRGTKKYLEELGLSAKIILPETPYLKRYENKVCDIVEQEYRKLRNPVHLVGWSYSGNVVLNVAEKCYDAVGKVVVVDSILTWKDQPLKDRILAYLLDILPVSLKEKIGAKDWLIRSMLDDMMVADIDERIYREIVEKAKEQGGMWNITALCDGIDYTGKENYVSKLARLSEGKDIHFIYASKDVESYVDTYIRHILPPEKIHKVSNSGHLLMLENPAEFNETLATILLEK